MMDELWRSGGGVSDRHGDESPVSEPRMRDPRLEETDQRDDHLQRVTDGRARSGHDLDAGFRRHSLVFLSGLGQVELPHNSRSICPGGSRPTQFDNYAPSNSQVVQ